MGYFKTLGTILIGAVGMTFATASAAQDFDIPSNEAEQLRRLDIMLMVMELHCRNTEHAFGNEYDAFAVSHRSTMVSASRRLRAIHAQGSSDRAQRRALDTLSTSMANRYGAGHPWLECSDLRTTVADLSGTQSRSMLLLAAQELLAENRPVRVAMDASHTPD